MDKEIKNQLELPPGDALRFAQCQQCGRTYTMASVKHFRNADGSVERYGQENDSCPYCKNWATYWGRRPVRYGPKAEDRP